MPVENGRRSGAQRFRDGLMIAALTARPLRVRNFAALKMGKTLTCDTKNIHVVFNGAGETKKGNLIEFDYPRALIAPMRWYLDNARPILRERATLPDDGLMWIGRRGRAMVVTMPTNTQAFNRHPPDGRQLKPNLRPFGAPGKLGPSARPPPARWRTASRRAEAASNVRKAKSSSTKTHFSCGF